MPRRLLVIGAGYVGLVSAACLAEIGHRVWCVDINKAKIRSLQDGVVPLYEPGLDDLIARNVAAGRLGFSDDVAWCVADADVVFIAVGTPPRPSDGHADLGNVYAVAKQIASALSGPTVVVTKSTVPVGTGDEIERIMRLANPAADVTVVSNPEFLREGDAIDDFLHPDRIVIGTSDEAAAQLMCEVYAPIVSDRSPVMITNRRTSELIKYTANAFLSMKVAFINEIADLCERVGGNVEEVSRGIGLDNRIGAKFLRAGPGYGGSCFPKDALALIKTAQDYSAPLRIVETVVHVNEQRKRAMARKVVQLCGGSVRGKTVAVLGLTFKPDTDDVRASPAISLIQALQDRGAAIRAYDPEGMTHARGELGDVAYADDPYSCAQGADVLVIVTEWTMFRDLDFDRLKSIMAVPALVDLRNIYRRADLVARGFAYANVGLGRDEIDWIAPEFDAVQPWLVHDKSRRDAPMEEQV